MKKGIIGIGSSAVALGLALLTATSAFAATVNVCPVNGHTGQIFLATGPLTVPDRVLDTPAFNNASSPVAPGDGPFWLAR